MQITLDVEHTLLLEELERVLMRFRMHYHTDLTENQIITEQKRQERKAKLQKFKGGLAKYTNAYIPTKGEWYEQ